MRLLVIFLASSLLIFACSDDSTPNNAQDTLGNADVAGSDTTVGTDTSTVGTDTNAGENDTNVVGSDTNVVGTDTNVVGTDTNVVGTDTNTGTDTNVTSGSSPVGGACEVDTDCAANPGMCFPEVYEGENTGFTGGYCMQLDCGESSPCPSGSECWTLFENDGTACIETCDSLADCRAGYVCDEYNTCWPGEACTATSCPTGQVCGPQGLCEAEPCTTGSCDPGFVCSQSSGTCIIDIGTAPSGTPPDCSHVPSAVCKGTAAYCGELLQWEPDGDVNSAWWDYTPFNGETASDQYRSYLRRDAIMLIKYAAAMTECTAAGWPGNGGALGLGDMSEADGAIPGTSVGSPGHPEGTHTGGYDIDLGYYQVNTADNKLRAVCEHADGTADAYHCTSEPELLDVWRTALYIAYLHDPVFETSGGADLQLRVVGVDGQVGPLVETAIDELCAANWYSGYGCTNRRLAYEVTNENYGWYYFHHHHFHVSTSGYHNSSIVSGIQCMAAGCDRIDPTTDPRRFYDVERARYAPPRTFELLGPAE